MFLANRRRIYLTFYKHTRQIFAAEFIYEMDDGNKKDKNQAKDGLVCTFQKYRLVLS